MRCVCFWLLFLSFLQRLQRLCASGLILRDALIQESPCLSGAFGPFSSQAIACSGGPPPLHFAKPVIIGQSMGGYVGQVYAQLFPDEMSGFVSIDSAPLQREYMTALEIWALKTVEPIYRWYPWKSLLKTGTNGVAASDYGRSLMRDMMMAYDGDQGRYAKLAGHGYKMLAEAIEADLPYAITCPALLVCGEKDRAGSCVRYNREWHKRTGLPIEWISGAGHNSNTDKPHLVNLAIEEFIARLQEERAE